MSYDPNSFDPDFYKYVRRYPNANLTSLLTKKHFDKLKKVRTSAELSHLLLSRFDNSGLGTRLIDHLTMPSDDENMDELKHHFLNLIKINLDPNDWYRVIYYNESINGKDVIGNYLLENNMQPDWLFELLITDLPTDDILIEILSREYAKNDISYSLIADMDIEKLLAVTQHLSDKKKMQLYLTKIMESSSSNSLIERARYEGKMSLLLSSIKNRKMKKELSNISDVIHLRERSAHFLGLQDTHRGEFTSRYSINTTYFEGMFEDESLHAFRETLQQYQEHLQTNLFQPEFEKIQAAFDNINFEVSPKAQVENYHDYYQQNNFVIIPSGWKGHSITVAATDKYLIVSNRGEGMSPLGGCIIYPLEAPLSKKDIKIFSTSLKQKAIEDHIEAIVKNDQEGKPIITHAVQSNPQKYGTCAIANKKLIIKGLLPLLIELREDDTAIPQFGDATLALTNDEYKHFTHFTRITELNELFEALNFMPSFKNIIADALVEYCNQHPYIDTLSEAKLLHQLISRIPEEKMESFLNQLLPVAKESIIFIKEHGFDVSIPPHFTSSHSNDHMSSEETVETDEQELSEANEQKVNNVAGDLKSSLIAAMKSRNEEQIKELINMGALKQCYGDLIAEFMYYCLPYDEIMFMLINKINLFDLEFYTVRGRKNAERVVISGNFPVFQAMLDKGINIERTNSIGDNLLHSAMFYGHVEIAEEIVDIKPSLAFMKNKQNETPITMALSMNNIEIVTTILKKLDPETPFREDFALEALANYCNQYPHIDHLAKANCLQEAIARIPEEKMEDFLRQLSSTAKDSVCLVKENGVNALIPENMAQTSNTIKQSSAAIMEMETRALDALQSNNVEALKELVNEDVFNKLDPNMALQIIFSCLQFDELIPLIISKTALATLETPCNEETILTYAARAGKLSLFMAMVEKGANIKQLFNTSKNLYEALYGFQTEIIEKAIELVPMPDIEKDKLNETLFFIALGRNQTEFANRLLRKIDLNKCTWVDSELRLLGTYYNRFSINSLPVVKLIYHCISAMPEETMKNFLLRLSPVDQENILFIKEHGIDILSPQDLNLQFNVDTAQTRTSAQSQLLEAIKPLNENKVKELINAGVLEQCDPEIIHQFLEFYIFNEVMLMVIEKTNLAILEHPFQGETILSRAADYGRMAIFNAMLEKGADIKQVNFMGNNLLHRAMLRDNIQMAERIIEIDPALAVEKNMKNETPLMMAYSKMADEKNKMKLFNKMLEKIDPTSLNSHQEITLLDIPDHDLALKLVMGGATFSHLDKEGHSALYTAITRGWYDVANILLDNGADSTLIDSNGDTYLMLVKDFEFARRLINAGVDIHRKNNDGFTAFDLATDTYKQYKIAKLLLREGAAPTSSLIDVSSTSLVKAMIDKGIDPHTVDTENSNALLKIDNFALAKLLIEHGVDIHHRNDLDNFPLYTALRDKYLDIAALFIQHAEHDKLLKDLGDPRVREIINRLPQRAKENLVAEIGKKISNEEMIMLRLVQGPVYSKRAQAMAFSKKTTKQNSVSTQSKTHGFKKRNSPK